MKNKEYIEVVNLKCGGCEKSVKDALKKAGLEEVEVSVKDSKVSFLGDREKASKILSSLGYPEKGSREAKSLLKKTKSYSVCASGSLKAGIEKKEKRDKKFWGIVFALVAFVALFFSFLFSVARAGFFEKFFALDFAPQIFYDEEEMRKDAIKEFDGAYKKEIEKSGKLVEIDMIAGPSEIEIFDGYKTKVWAYNRQVPGPEIRIKLGDTLKINFKNKLPQETTVHFHGIRVPNAMDGVPGVTQPPIKPGETFVYEFTPKDAGTFWFHPHVRSSEQIERGLFGTIVVEDEYSGKYSKDKVVVLDDWRLDRNAQVFPYFDTRMDIMHDGRWGNVISINGKLKEEIDLRPGERIRLRFVNTSNARVYRLYFPDELDAKAIAVDALYAREPFDPNGFDLAPGNRLDLDIKVPKSAKGSFLIYDNFTRYKNPLLYLNVSGEPIELVDFDYPKNSKVPKWSELYKLDADKLYVLNIEMRRASVNDKQSQESAMPGMMGMGAVAGMRLVWTINGKAYPDYEPVVFDYGKLNVFEFRNDSFRIHPMHLHGQFFKVIERDGEPVDEGFFRDTVLIYPKERVKLATVPYDKGKWMSHCHILEHAEAGMMTVVEVQ